MNRDAVNCPRCGMEVAYNRDICPSGHFVSFPNVRFAASMEAELLEHHRVAVALAVANGTDGKLNTLQGILDSSVATINVPPFLLRNIASGTHYSSYYRSLSEGQRAIAKAEYHSDRAAVDAKVHTGYQDQIINAQLSASGRGLPSYGAITLVLKDVAIADRASVLRENAFRFFERYGLGGIGAVEEAGWRAVWSKRAVLGVAHLAPSVTPATPTEKIVDLVASPGSDRSSDRFIEVHIFGQVDWQAIARAALEIPLTSPEDQEDWAFSSEKLSHRGVTCTDLSS